MTYTEDRAQQDRCHFFRIPAELRNGIYEYALTEDLPIRFDRPIRVDSRGFGLHGVWSRQISKAPGNRDLSTFVSALSNPLLEINQLRFVNKHLYAETRGLALRYNDLSFSYVMDAGYFLENCAPSHLSRIRRLTVKWNACYLQVSHPAANWRPIIQLCTTYYPNVEVRVVIKNLSPNNPHALVHLFIAEYVLRGTGYLANAMFKPGRDIAGSILQGPLPQKAKQSGQMLDLKNLIFFPNNEVFNEQEFREECVATGGRKSVAPWLKANKLTGGIAGMVHLMKIVIKQGI
jgi:hypothetical protein